MEYAVIWRSLKICSPCSKRKMTRKLPAVRTATAMMADRGNRKGAGDAFLIYTQIGDVSPVPANSPTPARGAVPLGVSMDEVCPAPEGLDMQPSVWLNENREAIRAAAERNRTANPRAFGSVLRGEDREDSDIDILVDALPDTSIFDLGGL